MSASEPVVVPPAAPATPASYYGRPILKAPTWRWPIPAYFFAGGLAGASSTLAWAARRTGDDALARSAGLVAAAAITVAPALLVEDLGRPERFANMLRVFKPTSPLNTGSWLLAAFGPAAGVTALTETLGVLPRLGRAAEVVAGSLGPVVATYTAVVVADTAVPAWHRGFRELPFLFAGSSAASAGAAAVALVAGEAAGPARRLVGFGVLLEGVAGVLLERRLGVVGQPYREGGAGRLRGAALALTMAGAAGVMVSRRRRGAGVLGGVLVLAGSAAARWAVVQAGFQSAADPAATVISQR